MYSMAQNQVLNTVDHINRNIQDWKPINLRWATRSEQCINRNPREIGKNKSSVTKSVHKIDLKTGVILETLISIREASRKSNVNCGEICKCCKLQQDSAAGFKWEYAGKEILCINQNGETWKVFPDRHDYFASNLGRIKRISQSDKIILVHDPILKFISKRDGYFRLSYVSDGQIKQIYKNVSHLVWLAFMGSIPEKYVIDHIHEENGESNKSDDRLENLQCLTHQENLLQHYERKRKREENIFESSEIEDSSKKICTSHL